MDIYHVWGEDLQVSPTGDLALVDKTEMVRQRILRRLMTAADGGYLWHPEYGAGVPEKVGSPYDPAAIQAVIRTQIMAEASVSRNPIPQITVTPITGGVYCYIQFWDAESGAAQIIQFDYTQ